MSIAFLADLHAANHRRHGGPKESGINRRCRQVLDTLKRAIERVNARHCDALVILGDLFDTTCPEPQIVAEVQQILKCAGMPVSILMGNHDLVSSAPGDHALGPLAPVAKIIDDGVMLQVGELGLCCVPFQPGPAADWLPSRLAMWNPQPDRQTALLLHLGLASDDTPMYLRGAHDSVPVELVAGLCKQYGFRACFAGNWHAHRVLRKKPLICQVGALAPTGYDNPGIDGYGTVVYWDGNGMEVEVVPGPRFMKLSSGDEWDPEEAEGCDVYAQIKAAPDATSAALANLEGAVGDGLVVAGEVVPDQAVVREAARRAATVARAADTLDEALAGYIENMTVAEGVDRAVVLERAKGYLGV